jgi:hypothetical protein
MTTTNLAQRAFYGKLTVEEVNGATKEKLESDKSWDGYTVFYCASEKCSIEVIEAILDKNVNINGLTLVSIMLL